MHQGSGANIQVYIPVCVIATSVKNIQHPAYVSIGFTRRISSAMLNSKTNDIVTSYNILEIMDER